MPYMPSAVRAELAFSTNIQEGATGMRARRVQEWLSFHKFSTAIDGDFGTATKEAVKAFQTAKQLPASGSVNKPTWEALITPLVEIANLAVPASASRDAAILRVAKAHLAIHPIELGGDNLGPWVRVYCGDDGAAMKWCAGFVTFVMKQACSLINQTAPVTGSLSCDSLAYQAKQNDRFVRGTAVANGAEDWSDLGSCQIFLVRASATDWTHTGFAFQGQGSTFSTIEGNTNDGGSSNGFEVCKRTRSIPAKDFIKLV